MKTNPSADRAADVLSYRMRKSVAVCKNGSLRLILDYPLKAVTLNLSWCPVIGRLSVGDFVPLEDIVSLLGAAGPEKTAIFLDGLVRKGFLEREGFPRVREYPFVSIIIPVRNRAEEIRECLLSLGKLDFSGQV